MNVVLQHKISQEEAVTRLKLLSDKLYLDNKNLINSIDQKWNGNKAEVKLKTKGLRFKGVILVTTNEIKVDLNLPFAALIFSHQIREQISKQLKSIL